MTKRIIIIVMLAVFGLSINAQNNTFKFNRVYVEIGGFAGWYSVNYERNFTLSDRWRIAGGIGFSPTLYWSELLYDYDFSPRIPIRLKFIYTSGNHSFENGLALTPYFHSKHINSSKFIERSEFAFFFPIGYKYSFCKKNFFIGATITPILYNSELQNFPIGALELGSNF
jgi:hypothetical protein